MARSILLDFESSTSLEEVACEFGDQLKYVAGRPDGFVAWAAGYSDPAVDALRQAATRWFGGSSGNKLVSV